MRIMTERSELMTKKLLCLFAAAAFFVLPAAPVSAEDSESDEGFIGLGARFSWDNYKIPVLVYSEDNRPSEEIDSFGGPNLGGEFQWGITNQFVLTLSLDFGYFKHTIYPFYEQLNDNGNSEDAGVQVDAHYVTFGAQIGAKFYFWDPAAGEAVLYLSGGIGKYFGGCGNDFKYVDDNSEFEGLAQEALDNQVEMIGDLASPFVFQLAIGAEFYATKSFGIGADILGLQFSYASTDVGQLVPMDDGTYGGVNPIRASGEQKILSFSVYSALTMTFNLTAGESSEKPEAAEEDGAAWGQPQPANDGWGGGAQGGWGTTAPAPAPAPATVAPAPAPAPANDGWGAEPAPAPPPPPPPPPPGY
jgi:hypothetical protein